MHNLRTMLCIHNGVSFNNRGEQNKIVLVAEDRIKLCSPINNILKLDRKDIKVSWNMKLWRML